MTYVTQGRWSVSMTTSSRFEGAVLNVSRHYEPERDGVSRYLIARGDGDGRVFPTTDAARAWAREHGYLADYRTGWCRACREQHTFLGRKSGFCPKRGEFVG